MIVVTPAEPANAERLAELAGEMARFYGLAVTEPPELRLRQIREHLFGDSPSAYAVMAWDDGTAVGFASYSFVWPAVGVTRSLYLKELYVAEPARHQGAGQLLMQHVFRLAVEHDCSRVEWTTDRDNPAAQRFYARLGVPVKESKLFYRVEGDELRQQAAGAG
jgi:GNAT superfamily N-acetyltransferase